MAGQSFNGIRSGLFSLLTGKRHTYKFGSIQIHIPDEGYQEGQPLLIAAAEDLTAERVKEIIALAKQIFEEGK